MFYTEVAMGFPEMLDFGLTESYATTPGWENSINPSQRFDLEHTHKISRSLREDSLSCCDFS